MFVFVVLLFCHLLIEARPDKHYLQFRFTALTRTDRFPEFSAEAVADDRLLAKYNNTAHVWKRESLNQFGWTKSPAEPPDSREWFIHLMRRLSNCTDSQCSQPHVLQRIIGCESKRFPNGSESLRAFDKYGFDGEDLLAFNSATLEWIEKNPKAKETKLKWDRQYERNQFIKYYLETCLSWISTFSNNKKSSPDVHTFARKNDQNDQHNINLTCLATGFYPREIKMNIRSDKKAFKNQTSSGIRPNEDGSFQRRISVTADRNHDRVYDCLVNHISMKKAVSVKWDKTRFDREILPRVIILGVVGALAVMLILLSCICNMSEPYGLVNKSGDDVTIKSGSDKSLNPSESSVLTDSSSRKRVSQNPT